MEEREQPSLMGHVPVRVSRRQVWTFGLLLAVWIMLTWPAGWQDLLAGMAAAAFATWVLRGLLPVAEGAVPFRPDRLCWALAYLAVLAWYVVKANLDVAYRVLHPAMPIRPGIVKVRTGLKTRAGIAALANSITLTPGTLTVNACDDGTLYVHWINVGPTDVAGASESVVKRFEWFLRRIFE